MSDFIQQLRELQYKDGAIQPDLLLDATRKARTGSVVERDRFISLVKEVYGEQASRYCLFTQFYKICDKPAVIGLLALCDEIPYVEVVNVSGFHIKSHVRIRFFLTVKYQEEFFKIDMSLHRMDRDGEENILAIYDSSSMPSVFDIMKVQIRKKMTDEERHTYGKANDLALRILAKADATEGYGYGLE